MARESVKKTYAYPYECVYVLTTTPTRVPTEHISS